ncbi:MAG: bifunctional riboflavin kinase/FAD synthetase [Deltaproteobacteria bacterium]|nr:bifunctional riboflavin kinase/FAD synthetase [Deltaproteobacteria bacterium]
MTMEIIRDLNDIPKELKHSIITIGNFDGIHLGHQAIFRKVLEEAVERNRKSLVITFDPHPQKVLHPEKKTFYLLTLLEEKLKLMEEMWIDAVIVIPFTPEFSRNEAGTFIRNILWEKLKIQKIYIGYDYAFGRGKEGNARFLKTMGEELGFQVEEIGAVTVDGMIVSSTNIRLSINEGQVSRAAKMLARPYNVSGVVVRGRQRGTDIGIPTANIESEKVIPGMGVYAIIAEVEGTRYQGVLNIGYSPTFGDNEFTIEVHLLNFQGDIYGKDIDLFFIERLRDEQRFDSPKLLVEQIKHDIDQAKHILAPYVI